ncbi:multicystatin-like [Macadamia integrifolia]|uniref:multicystatin-like n=1 Tax=Macadamia integrifolia TaxID=60698 RepID=UPI001C4F0960|nr:multicystatin-like [Macadamia integrifolia]
MEILSQQVSESQYIGRDKLSTIFSGWQPIIDAENPHVQGLGHSAVKEHNKKTGQQLVFKHVVMGWTQVVSGVNYRLIIKAEHGCFPNLYDAIVYEQPWQGFRELKSFKPLFREECNKPSVGGWQPIKDVTNPHVQELGQFAVTEHNGQSGKHVVFKCVVIGWTQVVTGVNYCLIIFAKDGCELQLYDAIVWEKPWEGFRQLISFKPVV